MQIEKLCLFCEHFYFASGEYGYSEYTPGYGPSTGCEKDHYSIDLYEESDNSFRTKLLTALHCPGFEFSADIADIITGMQKPARPSPISVTSSTPDDVTLTVD